MEQKKSFRRFQLKHLRKAKLGKGKVAVIAVGLCLVAVLSAVTLAYLIDTDDALNTFTPASVDCEVSEAFFDGTTKTDVTVKNTGTTSAYIRAIVVANWVDDENEKNVYYQAPVAGSDYSISYGTGWTLHDEYYYYDDAVAAGESTGELIAACTVQNAAPVAGYHLEVEIVAEAIQSEGTNSSGQTPAYLAWGYDPGASGN